MRTFWTVIHQRLFIILPVTLILITLLLATNLASFANNSREMAIGITLDLVFTVPLVYALLIRKKDIPKLTVVPFFVLGLVLATFFIPAQDQSTLDSIKTWVLPVVELTVFTVIFLKIISIRKVYKENSKTLNFYDALSLTTGEMFPPFMAKVMTNEISMIYFAFFSWRKKKYTANEFTYHKNGSERITLGVLLFVALIELFCVHLLLTPNYPILAWVLTGISAYGTVQIFGIIKSIKQLPYEMTEEGVKLRMGIMKSTFIPFEAIDSIEYTISDFPEENKAYQKLGLFDHNCIIHCNEELIITGMIGKEKSYRHLVLNVDDKEAFRKALQN